MAQDYSKLPEDLKAKLLKWEANAPANKQVQLLSDIADISQEMLSTLDDQKKGSEDAVKQFGATLLDMREQLTALNAKEAPETPDTSKPVIDAISKLEKALTGSIKAIDTKPVVNVPKVGAPVVNVDAPKVTVDNKEISKILKTDLPKAFNEAIKGIVIPENDTTAANQLLEELSKKLDSIDTGVRMKPQAPTSMAVTGALTNTELRATPVVISGAVTNTPPDIQNVELVNVLRTLLQQISVPSWFDPTTNTLRVGTTAVTVSSGTVTTVTTLTNQTNFGSQAADVLNRDISINTWANTVRRTIT